MPAPDKTDKTDKTNKELWPDIQPPPAPKTRKPAADSNGAPTEKSPDVPETVRTPPKSDESLAPPKPAAIAPPAAPEEIEPAKKPSPTPRRSSDSIAPLTEVPERGPIAPPIAPPIEKPAAKTPASKILPADDEPAAPSKLPAGGTKRESGKFLPGIGRNDAGDRLDRLIVDNTPKAIALSTAAAPEPPSLWSDSMPAERPNLLRPAEYRSVQTGVYGDVRLTVHNDTSSDSHHSVSPGKLPGNSDLFGNPLR